MHLTDSDDWTPAQKKGLIIGVIVAVIVVLGGLVYGYQWYQGGKPKEGVERVEDLGFGFRKVTIAKFKNQTELGHYPFFYYRDRMLSQIEPAAPPSVSPSGNFAVYQDPRSGKLILFRRAEERTTVLSASFIGLANPYVWHEQDGTVEAVLGKDGMSAVFPLK